GNSMAKIAAQEPSKTKNNIQGHVLRISGTVIDVQFPREHAPDILNELEVLFPDNPTHGKASLEVAQQLGDGIVRCIAIENIFDIRRGLPVIDTGSPIKVPVGKQVLGRIFNVLGQTIDDKPPLKTDKKWSIFRDPPPLIEQKIEDEIQETGIKVIDVMCPYIKGNKIGLFGGAGVGKTEYYLRVIFEFTQNFCSVGLSRYFECWFSCAVCIVCIHQYNGKALIYLCI
ncbi:unnamed protein product, partial [marine sediment metagenome]